MIELKDTIPQMTSSNYKERFYAEYWQTKIRHEKLKNFCNKIEVGRVWNSGLDEPEHDCPFEMLRDQQRMMGEYLHILELRAIIEKVDLDMPIVLND